MNIKRKALIALVLGVMLLSGCATSHNAAENTSNAGSEGLVKFPNRSSAWIKEGTFPNIENLRKIRAGMSKEQLYALISRPHFNEGFFGPKQWNYIFNFRTGNGSEFITCQYRIDFDNHSLTQTMYWDRPECADLLNPTPPAVAPIPAVVAIPPPIEIHKIMLNADALFHFNRSSREDILPEGQEKLDALVRQLNGTQITKLHVIGYTDRLGGDAYNEQLSRRRAQTIADYLVAQRISASIISAEGRGKHEPVVECNQKNRKALITCLSPNRRVEIEVTAQKN